SVTMSHSVRARPADQSRSRARSARGQERIAKTGRAETMSEVSSRNKNQTGGRGSGGPFRRAVVAEDGADVADAAEVVQRRDVRRGNDRLDHVAGRVDLHDGRAH